jgi:molybdate transport system substrate-binding protein
MARIGRAPGPARIAPRPEGLILVPRLLRVAPALAATATLAAGLVACSSSGGGGQASSNSPAKSASKSGGSLTVYAAASLTEAFNTLKGQFEQSHPGAKVTLNYGASSDLAAQITQGANVDVFASASPKNMQQVVSAGDASGPVTFATNTAEIAVPPSNPGKVTSVQDLAKKGVKVALCAPAVPCGVVAAEVFANAKIKVHPSASEADVKHTLAVVESGEVDAGVVYVTDVRSAGTKVKAVPIPDNLNASTEYPIAALKNSKNAPLAKAWVNFVQSAAGQKVLAADGFTKP